ncbi:MAG: ATP-binding cassette domain-containing protein [Gammaproteobacteria bacterium]
MSALDRLSLTLPQLPGALTSLSGLIGCASGSPLITAPPMNSAADGFREWLNWATKRSGIDAEEIETTGSQLESALRWAGPALVSYSQDDELRFVVLLESSRAGKLKVLGPDLQTDWLHVSVMRNALCAEIERRLIPEIGVLLQKIEMPAKRIAKVRLALLQERLAAEPISGIWLLRPPPDANFASQLHQEELFRRSLVLITVFAAYYLLEIAGWWLIARGALQGHLDPGWLSAWALMLLSLIGLRWLGGWLGGILAVQGATLLKRRLLAGALQMPADVIRGEGVGRLLGRVIESESLEFLAVNGAIVVPISVLELVLAAFILSHGAGGWMHVALLVLWCGVVVWSTWRLLLRLQDWSDLRLELAHDLVEQMVGHRTRLAQQSPEYRHDEEDQRLTRYLTVSREFDVISAAISGWLPRGWLLLGILGFTPVILGGNVNGLFLAIGLGGILLGYRAISDITANLPGFAQAVVAWRQISPIFKTVGPSASPATFHPAARPLPSMNQSTVNLEAKELVFSYSRQGRRVLDGCGLTIAGGDRILLKGASGSGKSTLVSLLCGLRDPDSGLLMLNGLDKSAWGIQAWRKTVAAAPQFHENYIFSAPFIFNVLIGRRWPPNESDLRDAEAVCRGLGLGELLERMPAGLMELVGETGWRLSHGERSRVFLARTVLQEAMVIVLDESFGSLDPVTFERCVSFVIERAPALVVVAHP